MEEKTTSMFTIGSRVEVSSDDEGFKDSWYVATVVDVINPAPTKKKKKTKHQKNNIKVYEYLVKYDTLYETEDGSVPLTEVVDSTFVRPFPPRYPRRNDEDGDGVGGFEVYDLVDAYHRDGWWTGVVTNVVENGEKFEVSFQNPQEKIQFEGTELRLHLDWVDFSWVMPKKQILEQATSDVSVSQLSENPTAVVLLSAKNENPSRGKSETKKQTISPMDGSLRFCRKRRSKNSRLKRYIHSEDKEGDKDDVNNVMEAREPQAMNIDQLADKASSKSLIHQDSLLMEKEMTNKDVVAPLAAVEGSENRANGMDSHVQLGSKDATEAHTDNNEQTVDEVDSSIPFSTKKRCVDTKENPEPSAVVHFPDKEGNKDDVNFVTEGRGAQDIDPDQLPKRASSESVIHQDSLLMEKKMIVMQETGEPEEGKSLQKKQTGKLLKLPVKRQINTLEDNQETEKGSSEPQLLVNGLKDTDTAIIEMPSDLDEQQTLLMWYEGLQRPTVLKNSRISRCRAVELRDESICKQNDSMTIDTLAVAPAAVVEDVASPELPFMKSSPVWATIASLEVFQKMPQTPHFSPLLKTKEESREGSAIGHMVTFACVVERTSKFKLTDSNDVMESTLETLADLENHGFDVGFVRFSVNKMLSVKAKVGHLEDETKKVENELKTRNLEKSILEEEINQLEVKIRALQEKLTSAVATKDRKDKEIAMLQSKVHLFFDYISEAKLDFASVVASLP